MLGTHMSAPRGAEAGSPTVEGRKIRVLLADDQALVREGLRQLLELEDDIEVIGDASTGEEAQQMVTELRPDVVLMDINMPDVDGITATRAILAEYPNTSIVILTMYREDDYAFQAVRAGARGYLLKNAGSQDVVRAVRVTSQGASMVDPTLVPSLLREFHRLVKEALDRSIAAIGPGVTGDELNRAVCELFDRHGYPTLLTKQPGEVLAEGFFHGLGHGVGLEVHEEPSLGRNGQALVPGDVVTVEPGLYRSGYGGVRLEDLVLVTEDGCENLTNYPYELRP